MVEGGSIEPFHKCPVEGCSPEPKITREPTPAKLPSDSVLVIVASAYSSAHFAISFGIRRGTLLASVRYTTTMVRLQQEQRTLVAETLRDIANIAAGAMVFGQFLGSQAFSLWIAVFGAGLWAAFVGLAIVLTGGRQQ